MKTIRHSLQLVSGCLAVAAILCLSDSVRAQNFTYTVDPSQSFLTLSGGVLTIPFTPQGTGSLFDRWSGTISASLGLGGTQLTFSGGSVITAGLNTYSPISPNTYPIIQSQPPAGDGVTVMATGPYGINNYAAHAGPALVPTYGLSEVFGAYQGLVLDVASGTALNGSASTANLKFTAGAVQSIGTALGGAVRLGDQSLLVGKNGNNASASLVSLTLGYDGLGNEISTLLLPVQFQTTGGSGRVENWTGQLVAVAIIPEPSTIALALVGFGLLAARVRRG